VDHEKCPEIFDAGTAFGRTAPVVGDWSRGLARVTVGKVGVH